jgi:hypothetical protein
MDLENLLTHQIIKLCTLCSLIIYATFFSLSYLLSILYGNPNFSPLTHYISELSLSQHSPFPYLYDLGCIIAGSLTIPITSYIQKTTLHTQNIQLVPPSKRKRFIILTRAAFISGLTGDVSFIGVGIFSLQRDFLGLHTVFTYLLFGGYALTALLVGILIVLYQTQLSTLMGLSGVVYPFVIFILALYIGISVPSLLVLYEWVVSISLTTWLFIFSIHFLYSNALFKP